jgi:hypothetical protein
MKFVCCEFEKWKRIKKVPAINVSCESIKKPLQHSIEILVWQAKASWREDVSVKKGNECRIYSSAD